jgi:hypothetical protein
MIGLQVKHFQKVMHIHTLFYTYRVRQVLPPARLTVLKN